ncbi:MAG: ribonuclease III [Planctomycetes bacterium]|nr:ribonuclease III [Planctomycetota bacterium]
MQIPHEFRDPALLELALTHASCASSVDNERLEYLGDAALDLIVAEDLYRNAPSAPEGTLTELKSNVVSRKTLARAALELGLQDRARLGGGLIGRALPSSVLANLYEAVLGAIYLDAGFAAAREFAERTLAEPLADARAARADTNPKQRLQHLTQARHGTLPRYELVTERGDAHARAFLVRAHVQTRAFPTAWGRTRKEAESWAAEEALLELELELEASSSDGSTAS